MTARLSTLRHRRCSSAAFVTGPATGRGADRAHALRNGAGARGRAPRGARRRRRHRRRTDGCAKRARSSPPTTRWSAAIPSAATPTTRSSMPPASPTCCTSASVSHRIVQRRFGSIERVGTRVPGELADRNRATTALARLDTSSAVADVAASTPTTAPAASPVPAPAQPTSASSGARRPRRARG